MKSIEKLKSFAVGSLIVIPTMCIGVIMGYWPEIILITLFIAVFVFAAYKIGSLIRGKE